MALNSELTAQGNWLFRYRSYLPVTILPLLFYLIYIKGIGSFDNLLLFLGIIITFAGELVRILTVGFTPEGTSGRNRNKQIADYLNCNGIYSIVRHPLYFGNYLIWLGISIFTYNIYFVFIMSLLFWLYYERIMFSEEHFLSKKFGEKYLRWSKITPSFFPSFKHYQKTRVVFSFKSILRREYPGMLAAVIGFTYIHIIRNFFQLKEFSISPVMLKILIITSVIAAVLRFLKHSGFMNESDRS